MNKIIEFIGYFVYRISYYMEKQRIKNSEMYVSDSYLRNLRRW